VPLRTGSSYTVITRMSDLWCPDTNESTLKLTPGWYSVGASIEGAGADNINGEGIKRRELWRGSATSEYVPLVVTRTVPAWLQVERTNHREGTSNILRGTIEDPSMETGKRTLSGEFKTTVRRIDNHLIEIRIGRHGGYGGERVVLRLKNENDNLTGWATFTQTTDFPAFDGDLARAMAASKGKVEVAKYSEEVGDRSENSGSFELTFGEIGTISGVFHSTTVFDGR
jgi:hypothetical protein